MVFDRSTKQRRVTSILQVAVSCSACWSRSRCQHPMGSTVLLLQTLQVSHVSLQVQIAEPASSNTDAPEALVMAGRANAAIGLPSFCNPVAGGNTVCSCSSLWSEAVQNVATRQGVQSYIFHETKCQPVSVLQPLCQCGQVMQYDGLQDAILNLAPPPRAHVVHDVHHTH